MVIDEKVDQSSALETGNYAISGSDIFSGFALQAEMYNDSSVMLTVENFSALRGQTILVMVSNVKDLYGNAIDPSENTASYTTSVILPVVLAESQQVTNQTGQVVIAQSNLSSGYLYIVLSGQYSGVNSNIFASGLLKGIEIIQE